MRKPLRWLSLSLLVVVALLLLAAVLVYVGSERVLSRRYPIPTGSIAEPGDAASVREGERLARVHGCLTGCHGRNGEGAVMFDQPLVARISAPNLTALVRKRTDAQLAAAIRHGLGTDGRSLFIMPAEAFGTMTDADLGRIVAYLRSMPPAAGPVSGVELGPVGRLGLLTGQFKTVVQLIEDGRPPPDVDEPVAARGRYLAMTTCGACHGVDLAGTTNPDFTSPHLAVVATYSPEDFTTLLRTGSALGGRELKTMSPTARANLSALTDEEIAALYRYLHAMGGSRSADGAPP